MSHLDLKGLRVRGRIGCKDSERAHPQMLRMDIRLYFDMREAIETDDVACSIDYKAIAGCVRELLGAREWHLLESCANDIGVCVRDLSQRITRVETTLIKDVIADAESVSATVINAR
jgi:dihydroneopterin aldolase